MCESRGLLAPYHITPTPTRPTKGPARGMPINIIAAGRWHDPAQWLPVLGQRVVCGMLYLILDIRDIVDIGDIGRALGIVYGKLSVVYHTPY